MAKKGFEPGPLDYKASAYSSFPCHSKWLPSLVSAAEPWVYIFGQCLVLGPPGNTGVQPKAQHGCALRVQAARDLGHTGAGSELSPLARAELHGGINKPFKKY